MGNCKDCKFWDRRSSNSKKEADCGKINENRGDDSTAFIDLSVLDDTGCVVSLKTGAMFGCVMFEERAKRQSKGNAS